MTNRIPNVIGILLVCVLAHSVSTDRMAHAQEQSSPTMLNSDAKLQAEIVFWQAIMHSNDYRDFKDYLKRFPTGQFVMLAHRRLSRIKITVKGMALLEEHGSDAIFFAVRSNDIDLLEWLKAQGANLNARNGWGDNTLMHEAAQSDAVDAMEWLEAHGADVNARDGYAPRG